MKWFLIDKTATVQPAEGTYKVWKPIVRTEAKNQCVYCAIHEAQFGGFRNFHVEHYKPKKIFPDLTNDIQNLFYSCAICNSFKGSSWPCNPKADHSVSAYPCPAEIDYATLLFVEANHLVASAYPAGTFVIERLFLNRPQLVMQRRFSEFRAKLNSLLDSVPTLILESKDAPVEVVLEIVTRLASATKLLVEMHDVVPYEVEDVKR